MHYTRAQLNKLRELSTTLTGVSSYWEKLRKLAVRVVDVKYGTREYVTLNNNKRGGPGTRMRVNTAIAHGLPVKNAYKDERPVSETLSYDELVGVMETALEYRGIMGYQDADRSAVVAYLVYHGRFLNASRVVLTNQELASVDEATTKKTEIDETVAKLTNENLKTFVTEALAKPSQQDSILLDAATFIKDLLYIQDFPEEATKHVQTVTGITQEAK